MLMSAPHESIVSTHRLCVEFDGEHVLEDVSLEITAGEFIALLGPNGSGKSTLIRALVGLQPIDHGRIALFGTPLSRFRDWHRIALVPQRLPGSTSIPVSVWETVLSAMIGPRTRWTPLGAARRARAQEALTAVGLWSRRHDRLDTLSGGQQRRVLIARALTTDPQLLILDEPTAGLDAENLEALAAMLTQLRARGITVIVVTHELDDLADLVTRAIVLRPDPHGSVQYDGPTPVPDQFSHDHLHHEVEHDAGHSHAPAPVIGLDTP